MLSQLPHEAFAALLLFCRLGAAVMVLPGLGEQEVPSNVRLALGLVLVLLLMAPLAPMLPPPPAAPAGLARLVLLEVGVGLWLGLLARLVALAMAQAGQIGSLMIGLVSPLQLDALMGAQTTAPARLFSLLAAAVVLSSGLYALPLRALVESYALLRPGAPLPLDATVQVLAEAVAESFSLAVRLAAPLVLSGIVSNLALAIISRLAPHVPIYNIGAPGQIGLGLLLLSLLLPALAATWAAVATELFSHLPGQG